MLQIATSAGIPPRSMPKTAVARAYAQLEKLREKAELSHSNESLWKRHMRAAWVKAYAIATIPAKNQSDLLMKIAAMGALIDLDSPYGSNAGHDAYKGHEKSFPLEGWEPVITGAIRDDGPGVLLASLRDDIKLLMEGA